MSRSNPQRDSVELPSSGQGRSHEGETITLPPEERGATELHREARRRPTSARLQRAHQPKAPLQAEEQIGPYRVIKELGRGGMGVIYLAHSTELGIDVALKILNLIPDSELLERFQTEARAAARLSHPHIVSIHDVGESGGHHYLAMPVFPGKSLQGRLDEKGPLDSREAAWITQKLAEALACAHRNQVLHRDVKPDNVLFSPEGNPLLTDFGLALDGSRQARLTHSGTILGTPCYMSPEQAAGDQERIDERADIYSLGATLYHLLTGRPPFTGSTLVSVIQAVQTQAPPSPSLFVPALESDLETICLKCLEKKPADRYASAEELAKDLTRYLTHQPILARRPSPRQRLLKWTGRNRPLIRVLAAASALFLVVSLALGIGFTLQYIRGIQAERDQALRAQETAESGREVAREAARQALEESLSICQRLREEDPRDVRRSLDLIAATMPLAKSLKREGSRQEARAYLLEIRRQATELLIANPELSHVEEQLARAETLLEGLDG